MAFFVSARRYPTFKTSSKATRLRPANPLQRRQPATVVHRPPNPFACNRLVFNLNRGLSHGGRPVFSLYTGPPSPTPSNPRPQASTQPPNLFADKGVPISRSGTPPPNKHDPENNFSNPLQLPCSPRQGHAKTLCFQPSPADTSHLQRLYQQSHPGLFHEVIAVHVSDRALAA